MSIRTKLADWLSKSATGRPLLAILGAGSVVWTGEDYYQLILAGYKYGTPVYSCVKLLSRCAAGVDWVVYKRQSDKSLVEQEDHEILRRLARPNPRQARTLFLEEVISDFILAGNTYIYGLGLGSRPPEELWILRPDRTRVLRGTDTEPIAGYRTEVEGRRRDYKLEEVLHLREFNPLDDFYGLSRLVVCSRDIDIYNASREWNLRMLQNDMVPRLGLAFERAMSREQRKELKDALRDKYQGYENARAPLVLEGSGGKVDIKTLAMSAVDSDWTESDKRTLRNICQKLNVPSMLLGDTEATTYNNYQEARRALYEDGVLPILDLVEAELNAWLVPRFGDSLVLAYDKDQIEPLQEDRGKKYSYLETCSFLSVNEKRAEMGFEDIPGGNVVLIPMSAVPLPSDDWDDEPAREEPEEEGEEPVEDEPEAEPGEDGEKRRGPAAGQSDGGSGGQVERPRLARANVKNSFWQAPERKTALWQSFVKRLEAGERGFVPALEAHLKRQAREIRELVQEAGSAAAAQEIPFNPEAEATRYREAFRGRYVSILKRAGRVGLRETRGILWTPAEDEKADDEEFTLRDELLAKLDAQILKASKFFNTTTWKWVLHYLTRAEKEGWTIEELTQRLWENLGDRLPWEARRIARTEIARTENFGLKEGYKQNQYVEFKSWLCSMVPDSRPGHIDADRRYSAEPIALDDVFEVEGPDGTWDKMDYPAEDTASAGNVCNCLCRSMPEVRQLGE
ncbi:MAG TPA: phage portal protein [Candidatus Aminicenantes bacterium]|nr:phage portal protein [Candidatus Aminicenantes bacterium]